MNMSLNSTLHILLQVGMSYRSLRSAVSGVSSFISKGGDTDTLKAGDNQVYTEVGFHKGNTVAIKRINTEEVALQRQDLLEMKAVSTQNMEMCH